MKLKYFFVTLALALLCFPMNAQKRTNLKILFVGGDSDIFHFGKKADSLQLQKSAAIRTASFTKLLNQYFKTVVVVNKSDYKPELSNSYDVTVFDGTPKPLIKKQNIYNNKGKLIAVVPAEYLPANYNRPTLTIAENSNEIGRSLGIKNDWYCLCLDADALGWKAGHPIFKGPYKVSIKPVMKATPMGAKEYAKIYKENLNDSTLMWSVQNKGYINSPNFRPGMVSRPDGYCDSPDAEIISGGVSAKSIDAVALGRHANFFHWGFSAAPYDMTPEGKIVFINSIIYISKFAGEPIARKMNDRISTRHYVDQMKYLTTREAWIEMNNSQHEFAKMVSEYKKSAKAKQAKGEELNEMEQVYLNYKVEPDPTYSEYLKDRVPDLYHIFGDDSAEYSRFYDKNRDYFYDGGLDYGLDIDEDVRTLSVANNDKRMLDKAITMLEKGEDAAMATRVLNRYTLCRFSTPAEWRNWYNTYNDKLFFTESGGWLWLVNTTDKNVPGNDYSILKNSAQSSKNIPALKGETDDKTPVLFSTTINKLSDGAYEILLRVKIHNGYHIYANVSDTDPFIQTKIAFDLPVGYKLNGNMITPPFKTVSGSATTLYEGDCIFKQKISGAGNGVVKCTINYQCCDNSICFPPVEKTFNLEIK